MGAVRMAPPARPRILTAPMAVPAVRAASAAPAVLAVWVVAFEAWDWKARRALMATAVSAAPAVLAVWVDGERMASTAALETIRARPAPTAVPVVRVARAAVAVPVA